MEVEVTIKRIIQELNKIFGERVKSNIDITFDVIEEHVFIFIKINNGANLRKIDLNIERDEISNFYFAFYENLKNSYLNSKIVSIGLFENINLIYPDDPYLTILLKEIHQNKVTVEFKNLGLEKSILETIKEDWISLINEEKKKIK